MHYILVLCLLLHYFTGGGGGEDDSGFLVSSAFIMPHGVNSGGGRGRGGWLFYVGQEMHYILDMGLTYLLFLI